VLAQTDLGPRTVGSRAHEQAITYIREQLERADWRVEIQRKQMMGHNIQNIVAQRGISVPALILGAHMIRTYSPTATPIPTRPTCPRANDGASGVAVAGLAHTHQIRFRSSWSSSSEDNGNIPGWTGSGHAFFAALDEMGVFWWIGGGCYLGRDSDQRSPAGSGRQPWLG
jgi:hypothetical protein